MRKQLTRGDRIARVLAILFLATAFTITVVWPSPLDVFAWMSVVFILACRLDFYESWAKACPLVCDTYPEHPLALWLPREPCDGDPVFFSNGRRVGTFHGDRSKPGGWYVEIPPLGKLCPEDAEKIRRVTRLPQWTTPPLRVQ